MFPKQVFGLTGSNLLARLPKPQAQCRFRLSYLLTAAGQLRIFTGFPLRSQLRETKELTHYILRRRKLQSLQIVDIS